MWLCRRQRSERELTMPRGAYLGKTYVDGSVALSPTPHSVNNEPIGGLNVPTPPMELRVRYRQSEQFNQARRRPERRPLIGAEANSAYNLLRTRIVRRLQENGWNTVAITSPSRTSGTTLTAINLAISIARNFSH